MKIKRRKNNIHVYVHGSGDALSLASFRWTVDAQSFALAQSVVTGGWIFIVANEKNEILSVYGAGEKIQSHDYTLE